MDTSNLIESKSTSPDLSEIDGNSASFYYFRCSAIYLEKYLKELYGEPDILKFEKSLLGITPKNLSERHRSLFLTETMLCNRIFTLSDSYFEVLSYEFEILTKGYLKYYPYKKKTDPIKAAEIDLKNKKIKFNRLKLNGEPYSFPYDPKEETYIKEYWKSYRMIRNPSTHHAHKISPFYFNARLITLSIAGIDLSFNKSWNRDKSIKSHVDLEGQNHFVFLAKHELPSLRDILNGNPSETVTKYYADLVTKIGLKKVKVLDEKQSRLNKFIFENEFQILLL